MYLSTRAAVAHDLLPEPPQRAVDERLHRLRVHALGDRRVAGEVGEQHRRLAPLLGQRAATRAPSRRSRRGSGRRRAARPGRPAAWAPADGAEGPEGGAGLGGRAPHRSAECRTRCRTSRRAGSRRRTRDTWPPAGLRRTCRSERPLGILGAAARASLSSHVRNDTWPPRTLRENRHALQADRRASRRARCRRPCAQAPRAASRSAHGCRRISGDRLVDRDVLHPWARVRLRVKALQVAVDQCARGDERLALHRLPLVAQLGRGRRAQDVGRAADRAPLHALERVRGLRVRPARALARRLAEGAVTLLWAIDHPRSSPPASPPRAWRRWGGGAPGRRAG